MENIRDNWLPRKNIQEIKHRIKNLTCSRAPYNLIKRWKQDHNLPLRQGWDYIVEEKIPDDLKEEGTEYEEEQNQSNDKLVQSKDVKEEKVQKIQKLRYFDEYYRLAMGIKWFGVGDNTDYIQMVNQ